jgi:hypothetical protein
VGFSTENALLLMSSRYLAADLKVEDEQPAKVEVKQLAGRAGSVIVLLKASDNIGLRAVVFLDRKAGTVLAGRKLQGRAQEVRQELKPLSGKSEEMDVQVIVTDEGGNQTRTGAPRAE